MTTALTNKTIWITGATSGMGRGLAIRLAKMGNFVIASSRRVEELSLLEQEYPSAIKGLPFDVADKQQLTKVKNELAAITDQLDMVIMSAGVADYEDDLSFHAELYEKVFSVNFFGAVNTMSLAMPLLKRAEGRAHIVGVSSLSVVAGLPRAQAYGASKAAFEYFLDSLRSDLPPKKYDVTIIRPGFVTTPMTAKNDFAMPFEIPADEAVDAMIAGMNKRARRFSFPWQLSGVLRLISWMPSIWYSYLAPKVSRHKKV